MNRHEGLVGAASRLLEALYELAQLKFYKERVRPSTRTRRAVAEGEPDEVPPEETDDEEEDDETTVSPFEEGAQVVPREDAE